MKLFLFEFNKLENRLYDVIKLSYFIWSLIILFSIPQVDVLSKSKEFEDITLRVNEKKILNTLNKDKHRATIR